MAHPQKPWLPPLPSITDLPLTPLGEGGAGRLLLAIGPDAGWEDPYELDLLQQHGFQPVSLGPRTLRTDVALVAMLTLAHDRIRRANPVPLNPVPLNPKP